MLRAFVTLSALASLASASPRSVPIQPTAGEQNLAPYRVLDRVEGDSMDLLFTPVRPMAVRVADGHIFAANSHDSTVVEYDDQGALLRTIRVPWGPVSVALWSPPWTRGSDYLLVVCRGSYTLAYVDLSSGRIVRLVDLPTEPSDILVHPTSNRAFVSCSGDDSVVEINVRTAELVRRYPILSKRPTFLCLDGDDVLVAPMLSGNNSLVETGGFILDPGPGRVLDLEDPSIAMQGLADHDLFRITPGSDAVPVATDMGAVLFALGKNPLTGDIWQLGTEANNKDATRPGEPAVRGDFIVNQIAMAQPMGGSIVEPTGVFNLDDADPASAGVQFDPSRSVGQPYNLDFDLDGDGYVVGLLTANVTQLSAAGAFIREWDVGPVPRMVLVDAAGEEALVYCWGNNTIEKYDLTNAAPNLVATLDLGFDPTPENMRVGRNLFFDAGFSMHHNASCASCHVETETDMLAWDLSDLPFDDKGPLVTQTMRGIADLVPLHWRGERRKLVDFNPAFDGLLGGPELDTTPGGEFDQFEAFVFSLEQPANPNSHPRRLVDGTLDANGGDAVRGQESYFDDTSVPGVGSCNACHTLPTGTNNEVVLDEPQLEFARRTHFVVASFNALWRKSQPTLENVVFADGSMEQRPTIGAGVSAAGLKDSVLDFVQINLFSLNDQQDRDIAAFVDQVDSGLAPVVHRSWILNERTLPDSRVWLRSFLMRQAVARNADIAVFGSIDLGMGARELRWFWDRVSGLFLCEDSTVAPHSMKEFLTAAEAGLADLVFLGLPVGMARRFAADFDRDGLFNLDEVALGVDPENFDSDGDGDRDGHEVDNGGDPADVNVTSNDLTMPQIENLRVTYATTQVAKLQFDTTEPARVDATWTMGSLMGTVNHDSFDTNHTLILTEMRIDKLHTVAITVTDLAGNATAMDLPGGIQTLPAAIGGDVVFKAVSTNVIQNSAGTLHFTMNGRGRRKETVGGVTGSQLRVSVYVNGSFTQSVIGTTSGGDGSTTVDISESGLNVDDEVRVVVDTIYNTQANTGTLWNMPATTPANREVTLVYDGQGP